MWSILDAKYENENLNTVMAENFQHLNATEYNSLQILLSKFEYLLDGTLGTWKTTLVHL